MALEELFPGIQEQLRAAGAVAFDTGDLAWLAESGWAPHGVRQFPVVSATRIVAVVGSGDRRPPRDAAGYEAFFRELRDPILAELVACGRPLGEVHVHRQTANRRHHYERINDWPPGLLVVGDAFCAFDPVYGQGVAVAACEALLMRRALDSGMRPGNERALLRAFRGVVALPWAIASGEDLRLPTSTGTQTVLQRMVGAWTRELGRLSSHGHRCAQSSVARVYHLMASPRLLYQPTLVAAALRARIRGYGPPVPRPTVIATVRR